jgi:hypothetical protein
MHIHLFTPFVICIISNLSRPYLEQCPCGPLVSGAIGHQLGQTDLIQGALSALGMNHRRRCNIGFQQLVQASHCFFGLPPQGVIENNLTSPAGAYMEDGSCRDGGIEHFFQAKGLGAELHIVIVPSPPLAVLVLDGIQCGPKFDEIGDANQSQAPAAQPQSADDTMRLFFLGPSLAGMHDAMDVRSFYRVMIVHP